MKTNNDFEEGHDTRFIPDIFLEDGQEVEADGWTIKAIHTPGHTSNHMCYGLEEDKILFKNPTSFAKPIALIKEGRLLILEKCEQEWCQITSGKFQGWVKTDNIWGFN